MQVAYTNTIFAVRGDAPYKSVQDFVEQTKQRKMAYGSNGFGTTAHLWVELFKQKTGADLLHVPYKGAAPSAQALFAGETDFLVGSPASLKGFLDAGRLRPLAVTSAKRMPAFPNTPTMAESGYPDLVVGAWFGMLAPPNMSPALADRLHEMVSAATKTAEFQKVASTFMFDSPPVSRAAFTKMVNAEVAVWKASIDAAGIKPED